MEISTSARPLAVAPARPGGAALLWSRRAVDLCRVAACLCLTP